MVFVVCVVFDGESMVNPMTNRLVRPASGVDNLGLSTPEKGKDKGAAQVFREIGRIVPKNVH
ncbi:hypothetical protein [Bifidobacterium ramosum]|uniref:Uncharacterized protein n=1 Tax=Bifidobacterium ramosum TaxID=1798158 RepID=A0A7K3TA63_9BIFI|nr:hypothetical protein [Bifidobacterium ramosum]NEG71448.1 hypothetical protein [Bifidobacterium ramosum]